MTSQMYNQPLLVNRGFKNYLTRFILIWTCLCAAKSPNT